MVVLNSKLVLSKGTAAHRQGWIGNFNAVLGALMSPMIAGHDPPCGDCFRPCLLRIIVFPEGFFSPPPLGWGGWLQDDFFLFVFVCPRKAWDLIWLLRICFCYLAGIVGGCVNEDPSVYKEMDI